MSRQYAELSETSHSAHRGQTPGQAAVVLASLAIGVVLMGIQLWLLTVALDLYLGGADSALWPLAAISGGVFVGGLLVLYMVNRGGRPALS